MEKICKTCGKKFKRKAFNQKYCCRKCFKKANYAFHKGEKKYPTYRCENCGKQIQLDFNPLCSSQFERFRCPFCNHLRLPADKTLKNPCKQCERAEAKLKGFCKTCYYFDYYQKHKEKKKLYARTYYKLITRNIKTGKLAEKNYPLTRGWDCAIL